MTQGSVESSQTLWDQQAHLNEHDVVLLSCEGQETTGGDPGVAMNSMFQTYLMNYANAGGRVLRFALSLRRGFNTGPFATGANTLAHGGRLARKRLTIANPSRPDVDTTLARRRGPFQRAQRWASG